MAPITSLSSRKHEDPLGGAYAPRVKYRILPWGDKIETTGVVFESCAAFPRSLRRAFRVVSRSGSA
jgi:hypothetical protein